LAFAGAASAGPLVADGYSPVDDFVSELAASGSDARAIMTAGFFAFAVGIVVFAWSLRTIWPALATVALILAASGVGTLLAGTFACDPGCPTTGDRSLAQQLHDGASVLSFASWLTAMALTGWRLRHETYGRASLALATVALGSFLTLGALRAPVPHGPVGLVQRIMLAAVIVWFMTMSAAVRRRCCPPPTQSVSPTV
jgi:hypothetical protein